MRRPLIVCSLLLLLIPRSDAAPQPPCQCKHLKALRQAAAEAALLRDIYQRKAKELAKREDEIIKRWGGAAKRSPEMDDLTAEFRLWIKETAERAVSQQTAAPNNTSAPRVSVTQFDAVTCEPNRTQLTAMMRRESCNELAQALKNHEDYHHDVCVALRGAIGSRRTQWPIDRQMLSRYMNYYAPSSTASEEASAYSAQIAELNRVIKKVESKCKPRWKGTTHLVRTTCLDTSLVTIDAQLLFELSEDNFGPGIETYYAQGTATMTMPPYTWNDYRCSGGSVTFPLCANNAPSVTMLQIDTNTDPPTYRAMGGCLEPAISARCSNGRNTIDSDEFPGTWFRISKDFEFAAPVFDNNTLTGRYVHNPGGCNTYESSWHFTREVR